MNEQTARREIVRVGQLMYERSYVVSSDGNVSVRLDDGRILATPTQTNKGRMTEDSLALTDIEGKPLNERTASTDELTAAMLPLVKHHNALLMANHGAVAYGEDVWQAFDRLETLEHTAKIAILARALGGASNLPPDAIEKLINVREKAGYLDERARCQSCGYLHETQITCATGERMHPTAARAGGAVEAN